MVKLQIAGQICAGVMFMKEAYCTPRVLTIMNDGQRSNEFQSHVIRRDGKEMPAAPYVEGASRCGRGRCLSRCYRRALEGIDFKARLTQQRLNPHTM